MHHVFDGGVWTVIGRVLTASLPVVIAGIATYIAWQQFAVNRRQHRLALFEKRLVAFNSTMKMISSVIQAANADLNQCFEFIKETRDHEFLFGPEVGAFIDEVYHKAVALHAQAQMGPGGAEQFRQTLEWFVGQS